MTLRDPLALLDEAPAARVAQVHQHTQRLVAGLTAVGRGERISQPARALEGFSPDLQARARAVFKRNIIPGYPVKASAD